MKYLIIILIIITTINSKALCQRGENGQKLEDKFTIHQAGISLNYGINLYQIDGLEETLIISTAFLDSSYTTSGSRRIGSTVSLDVPIQFHEFFYTQFGIQHESSFQNTSSDFRFNDLKKPEKSYDLWLNYNYFGLRVESGVSIPLIKQYRKRTKSLILNGLTITTGIGFKFTKPTLSSEVIYQEDGPPTAAALDAQKELQNHLIPENRLHYYWTTTVGYKNFFASFVWESNTTDAIYTPPQSYTNNFKNNRNTRSNIIVGLGVRLPIYSKYN